MYGEPGNLLEYESHIQSEAFRNWDNIDRSEVLSIGTTVHRQGTSLWEGTSKTWH